MVGKSRGKKLLGRTRLRWANKFENDVKEQDGRTWTAFKWMCVEEMVGCYEHDSETSGYVVVSNRCMSKNSNVSHTRTNNR